MKKTLAATLCLAAAAVMAQQLPFVGERGFNIAGGSGTEQTIRIGKNGQTVVKLHGTSGSEVLYRGKFANPIPIDHDGDKKPDSHYLIKGKRIYELDANRQMTYGCRLEEKEPCASELY